MTHFHANYRSTADGSNSLPRSLGSFVAREDAATGVFQVIGRRLQETGWVTLEAFLPATAGLGHVQIENVVTGERVSSAVWGCGCEDGERDVRGLDSGARSAARERNRRESGR